MCEAKKSFVTSPKLLSFFLKYMFFDSLLQIQKQPPKVFFEKRCSQKFRKIHKKTPEPESLF